MLLKTPHMLLNTPHMLLRPHTCYWIPHTCHWRPHTCHWRPHTCYWRPHTWYQRPHTWSIVFMLCSCWPLVLPRVTDKPSCCCSVPLIKALHLECSATPLVSYRLLGSSLHIWRWHNRIYFTSRTPAWTMNMLHVNNCVRLSTLYWSPDCLTK